MIESLERETDWLDALRMADKPVLLYGMGNGADKILALLSGAGRMLMPDTMPMAKNIVTRELPP